MTLTRNNSSKVREKRKSRSSANTGLILMLLIIRTVNKSLFNINGNNTAEDGRFARKSIGFMTNQTALYDRLSPYEMVKYFADLNGMEKARLMLHAKEIHFKLPDGKSVSFEAPYDQLYTQNLKTMGMI